MRASTLLPKLMPRELMVEIARDLMCNWGLVYHVVHQRIPIELAPPRVLDAMAERRLIPRRPLGRDAYHEWLALVALHLLVLSGQWELKKLRDGMASELGMEWQRDVSSRIRS